MLSRLKVKTRTAAPAEGSREQGRNPSASYSDENLDSPAKDASNRALLAALYKATDGNAWHSSIQWNTESHLSNWKGVKVSNDQVCGLDLERNNLRGKIPAMLGRFVHMKYLYLEGNQLSGSIPADLGNLTELTDLYLSDNNLTGKLPASLGKLTLLKQLHLNGNKLSGEIPAVLGKLRNLQQLFLYDNKFTGVLPKELASLPVLVAIPIQNTGLTGGPTQTESVDSWRKRRLEQRAVGSAGQGVKAPASRGSSSEQDDIRSAPPTSWPTPLVQDTQQTLKTQVASFPGVDELVKNKSNGLEEIRQLFQASAVGRSSPDAQLGDMDRLRELDKLAKLAKELGEVAVIHMEDKEAQQKELAYPPDSKAYYTAVRTGLCNAFLAASVIASRLVCTSATGSLGAAGKALELLAGTVPFVGGLAGFAAAAATAGDRYIQTRRVTKITDMASDAVECSVMARRLAMRLTDGLTKDTSSGARMIEELGMDGIWSTHGGSSEDGRHGRSPVVGVLRESASEEEMFEWFVTEVVNIEHQHGSSGKITRAVQLRRRLGKRHLHKLLKAVGQDCLRGANSTEEKVDRLFLVILPNVGLHPSAFPNASRGTYEQRRVAAPSHDGSPGLVADINTMKAKMEALELENEEFMKMKAKMEALELDNKSLLGKVAVMEKKMPKPHAESAGVTDAGGGTVLMQERKVETQEEFWQSAENTAAGSQGHMLNYEDLQGYVRELQARVKEVDSRVDNIEGGTRKTRKKWKLGLFGGGR